MAHPAMTRTAKDDPRWSWIGLAWPLLQQSTAPRNAGSRGSWRAPVGPSVEANRASGLVRVEAQVGEPPPQFGQRDRGTPLIPEPEQRFQTRPGEHAHLRRIATRHRPPSGRAATRPDRVACVLANYRRRVIVARRISDQFGRESAHYWPQTFAGSSDTNLNHVVALIGILAGQLRDGRLGEDGPAPRP